MLSGAQRPRSREHGEQREDDRNTQRSGGQDAMRQTHKQIEPEGTTRTVATKSSDQDFAQYLTK